MCRRTWQVCTQTDSESFHRVHGHMREILGSMDCTAQIKGADVLKPSRVERESINVGTW